MQYSFIALCVFALVLFDCAAGQESAAASAVAAKQQSAPARTQVEAVVPPRQSTAKAPKAASAPGTPVSAASGFPMSPADAVRLIEPKQAAHVGGGWGRNSGEAVLFMRGDKYYNYIMLEHFLIIARNRMFTTTEKGEDYAVLNDRVKFMRSSVDQNKRKYDYWQYTFIISKKSDIGRARKIVESTMKGPEKEKRLKEFTETFTQEFWFDVTDVFNVRSEDMFKGLGKKVK